MDVGLNTRAESIIRALLNDAGPTAVAELSARLHCTPRMIRYCLTDVRAWLVAKGVPLEQDRRRGIWVEVSVGARKDLLSELEGQSPYALKIDQDRRLSILAVLLLSSPNPPTIGRLAKAMGVSRSTAQKDVTLLKVRVRQKYGLSLRTVPGKGVVLTGGEAGLRQAMVDSIMDSVNDSELLTLLKDIDKANVNTQSGHRRESNLLDVVFRGIESSNLDFLRRQIRLAESALEREFSETARVALLVHLAIAIGRLKSGHDITMAADHLGTLKELPEYAVALSLAREIDKRFEVAVPEAEVGYMTIHLAGAKRGIGGKEVTTGDSETVVRGIVQDMVSAAEAALSRRVCDPGLIDGLIQHLVPAYYRIRYSLPIRNPLLHEIKTGYPDLFEAAVRAAEVFSRSLGVDLPEEEVAYVAIHLGAADERAGRSLERPTVMVLCASGIGTANLLASRLASEFPTIEIAGPHSALEILSQSVEGIDAIVSTVPVSVPGLPCVTVSPTLPKEDCELVGNLLSVIPVSRRILGRSGATAGGPPVPAGQVIHPEGIRFNVNAGNWVDAVTEAGQALVELGFCEPRYVTAMVDKVRRFGGYVVLGNGVALPHATPADGVLKPGASLVRLAHPVVFPGRASDPVVLVIGLAVTRDASEEMVRKLNAVLSGPGLDSLKKARRLDDLIAALDGLACLYT